MVYTGTLSTSATATWSYWIGTTGTLTSSDPIWDNWSVTYTTGVETSTTITGAGTATTWTVWVEGADIQDARRAQQVVRQQRQRTEPTAEQREQWRREEQERRARQEAAAKVLVEARERARRLLVACLTPEQREDLVAKKCFYLECHSPDGTKRRYRIDEGTHGNVKLLDDKDKVVGSYCVQPDGVPTEDAMLAQKLWLETNEEGFKRAANFRRWVN